MSFIRPSDLAEDSTHDYPVLIHSLIEAERVLLCTFDLIVVLRPTSPLRRSKLIEEGVNAIISNPKSTSFRTDTYTSQHTYRQWLARNEYIVGYEDKIDEPYNIPPQGLPNAYLQTGHLEIIKRETLIDGSITGSNVLPLILSTDSFIDIDYKEDLIKAENALINESK